MDKKIPGEGKTYKILPDGRILLRSSYWGSATVVLTAAEYDRIKKLSLSEVMLSTLIVLPVVPMGVLTLDGRIAIPTALEVLLPIGLLSWLVHVYFKRRQQAILQRAPIAAEQLPGFGLRDYWTLVKASRAPKHLLFYLIIGCLGGWWMVIGRFFGAEFATDPKAPSLLSSLLSAVACTVGLVIYWRKRRKSDEDVSP